MTLGNGQLMTHNHKPVVHMRTMSTMVLILLRPAFEILNQCLKAFRLFMHNLTPTKGNTCPPHLWGGRKREGGIAESTAFLRDDEEEEVETH